MYNRQQETKIDFSKSVTLTNTASFKQTVDYFNDYVISGESLFFALVQRLHNDNKQTWGWAN